MRNREVNGKLGNMRKDVSWTVYPLRTGEPVQIQSDNRIARVDLTTGFAVLANKGSTSVAFLMGTTTVPVPHVMLDAIKAIVSNDNGTGIIQLTGAGS
jgi:hypothetical protein